MHENKTSLNPKAMHVMECSPSINPHRAIQICEFAEVILP